MSTLMALVSAAKCRDFGGLTPTTPHDTPQSSIPKVWMLTQW